MADLRPALADNVVLCHSTHYAPRDDFGDAFNLVVGRRTRRAAGKDEVDGVDEARQRLGQVSRFELTQSLTKRSLATGHTHTLETGIWTRNVT